MATGKETKEIKSAKGGAVKKEKKETKKEAENKNAAKETAPEKNEKPAGEAIKFVLMTEKSVQGIETQNRIVFVIDRKATKGMVAKSVEAAFGAPVQSVRTMFDQEGRKRAFVKFKNPGAAGEVAIKLGII